MGSSSSLDGKQFTKHLPGAPVTAWENNERKAKDHNYLLFGGKFIAFKLWARGVARADFYAYPNTHEYTHIYAYPDADTHCYTHIHTHIYS